MEVDTAVKKGCLDQENWSFGFPYKPKELILGFQHLFAFFGATVLVPLITGMNPSTALATAGIGTLVFHYLTKLKVPIFLGSSFSFIGAIVNTVIKHGPVEGPQYACAGVMIAAVVSFILAWVIYFLGVPRVQYLFPPVVTGTIIIVIGVGLAYSGVNDYFGLQDGSSAMAHFYFVHQWASILIGTFTICVVICCMAYMKNFLSLIPILIGMGAGYILCLILRACTLPTIDFQPIVDEKWINLPYGYYYLKESNPVLGGIFMLPKWDWVAILSIAPLAFVTFMEHIGDITAIGRIVGQDFFADPCLHRTMAADALGSFIAGFLGGPEITTYSENTGVLATTKVFDPRILRLAALYGIALSIIGKFGGVLRSIPAPVKGAVSIVLFGMIASCGISSMVESHVDLSKTRNLIIVSLILSTGLGINTATYANGGTGGILVYFGKTAFGLSGLFVCTIVGVVANLVLPMKSFSEIQEEQQEKEKEAAAQELGGGGGGVEGEIKTPSTTTPDLNESGNVAAESAISTGGDLGSADDGDLETHRHKNEGGVPKTREADRYSFASFTSPADRDDDDNNNNNNNDGGNDDEAAAAAAAPSPSRQHDPVHVHVHTVAAREAEECAVLPDTLGEFLAGAPEEVYTQVSSAEEDVRRDRRMRGEY